MPPTIRLAAREDLAALHPIIERAYRGDAARLGWTHEADLIEGERTDIATLAAIIETERLLIALDGGGLIGCVQLADRGDGLAYLGLLCVELRSREPGSANACSTPPRRSPATICTRPGSK